GQDDTADRVDLQAGERFRVFATSGPAGPSAPPGPRRGALTRRGPAPITAGRADVGPPSAATWGGDLQSPALGIPRKEVIQPQVPLRLPCYDLVPIRGFTFGACPRGRQRLRVPPPLVA